jgi:CRP/FNR family cyclic AMP-dependent transcriptional regulator
LIASGDDQHKKKIKEWLEVKYSDSVIYTASDYMECLLKIKNAPPNVLITDFEIAKGRPGQIIDTIITDLNSRVGIIAIGSTAKNENHFDAITMGRLHFFEELKTAEDFYDGLMKISNFAFQNEASQYSLRFLKAGEVLIKEGESTQQVYIVRKGVLKAFKKGSAGDTINIGEINAGEFVGEMAYFNDSARMASVAAVVDSELIEIQPQVFEKVIYQRPSWAKTLITTLAKRLKSK